MLKIKSNTNEFTIIFFWEDLKENKCWKIICSALSVQRPFSIPVLFLFQFQRFSLVSAAPPFSISASAPHPLFFSFGSAFLFFFFLSFVLPFLFNLLFFSPKPCWAQSPKRFASVKSTPLFSFSACLFVQLAPLFQPFFVLFQPLFFLFHVLPSKSPQTCLALFVRASSVSCQLLRP